MLRTYALAPDTIRRFLRRMFWRVQIIALLSFLGFGGYLAFLASPIHWEVAGPMVAIIALAYFFIIFFNLRQQLRAYYAVRYEIDDSSVVCRQAKQIPNHISRANIVRVDEQPEGIFIVTTSPKTNLLVPFGLAREGDTDFYNTLQAWVEIRPLPRKRRLEPWLWLFGLGGSLLVLLFANSLWVILPLGLVMLVSGITTGRRLKRANSQPIETMRTYNMSFSLLMIIITMKTCLLGILLLSLR
jgi:hypothetical protein